MLLFVFLFIFFVPKCYGVFHTSNETDLSKCKVYYSRSGTSYKEFFELQKPNKNESDLKLDFHFSVLSASDAHILIATTKNPQKTDPAYEVVIGAGGNTFCDIRRMQKNQVKESVRIKGLLSAVDPRSFWIHMTKDGVLEVGKEGKDLAFISWKDHEPLPVTTIGFSTWPGIEAKWYFDCITDDIKKIKRNLTDEERLRRDLLNHYDPMVPPKYDHSLGVFVKMAPQINRVSLDESKAILHSRGVAHLMWMDEKLRWNGSLYGGITQIRVSSAEIWKPSLMVSNHYDDDYFIADQSLLLLKNKGFVYWFPTLNLKTWCEASSSQYANWPKDKRSCDIIFTFLTHTNELWVNYTHVSDPVYENTEHSDWMIEEVDVYPGVTTDSWIQSGDKNLFMTVELRRNSEIYSRIFLTIYFVIVIAILCSFCVSPFGPYKICLGCFQMVLSISCLIYLGILLPGHYEAVPYIVRLHGYGIYAGIISILVSIAVINITRIEKQKQFPNILSRLFTSSVFKTMFCLPEVKRDHYGNIYTMTRAKVNQQYYILLGVVIDRISLLVGIGLAAYSVYLY